jgi:hypothetical protein
MRVAYLVTAYTELQHLQRLCSALRREDPSCTVRVQFDCGSPHASAATRLGPHVSLTDEPIRWGDGTYVRALIRSLTDLLEQPWDWVVLLSGQDYPVRSLDLLHLELETGDHAAYAPVTGRLPDTHPPRELVERYTFRYLWSGRPWPRALRAAARRVAPAIGALSRHQLRIQPRPRGAGPGVGVRRRTTIFSEERPCWWGSDYVAMRRDTVAALLDILGREPEVLDYFASTFVPSEALFASMVRWIDAEAVADRSLHFMHFGGRPNPRPVTEDDLAELWERGAFFARKFDDSSTWVEQRLPLSGPPT